MLFLQDLKSLAPSIKFTLEIEQNSALPIIEVLIFIDSGMKVYRKPSNILSYVHYFSNHHINVKKEDFISVCLRGYRISDPEFLDAELINNSKNWTEVKISSHCSQ